MNIAKIEPETTIEWPDPTPEMLDSSTFAAVWNCIKHWDISVPGAYSGYSGATGNHIRAILDALRAAGERSVPYITDTQAMDWLQSASLNPRVR